MVQLRMVFCILRSEKRRLSFARGILCLCMAFVLVLQPVLPSLLNASILDFTDFTITDEIKLGKEFEKLVLQRLPLIEDPEIKNYIKDVVKRIEKVMPAEPFDIKVNVVNNNAINAFAGPAGFMFVFSGLILHVNKESELAGVIAHELGHIHQRHIAKRIKRMNAMSLFSIAGMLAGVLLGGEGGQALATTAIAAPQSAMLQFSREDEREADHVGLNFLTAAGYPPRGLSDAFQVIMDNQWAGRSSTIPSYFSTHPGLKERMEYLEQRIKRLPAKALKVKDNNDRLFRVQTVLRARYTDPKNAVQYFTRGGKKMTWLDYMGLGMASERLNMMVKANEAFNKALAIKPDDPLLVREAGIFYFTVGKFEKAGEYLQKAIFTNPKDLFALFYYARLLAEEKQPELALSYYERVLKEVPKDAEVYYYYGRAYGESGNLFKAHLLLAYSAFYAHQKRKIRFHLDKAERLVASPDDKEELKKLKETMHDGEEPKEKAIPKKP